MKVSSIGRLVPGIAMLVSYNRDWLRPDLLAGVTVWAMLVPQTLGYASLAGMPAVNGIYAAFGAMLLYWLWGSSRELNVGPEGTVAIMVATVLGARAAAGSEEYVDLAAVLAILVGLILIIGGIFRLGKIADFLSRPILAGYVFGSGLLIIGSQLADLTGIDVDSSLYASDIGAVLRNLDLINWTALGIGAGTIAVMVTLRRIVPVVPGALVAVIGSVILVSLGGLEDTVAVVGEFPSGLPALSIPSVSLNDIAGLVGPAFAIALLVYPDSMLTARSLSVVNKYRVDANAEFYGVGAANLGAALFQGFPVNGSQSRSYVVSDAGAKSQVSSLWAAFFILLTVVFLAPFFENLPLAALAGIVIVAGAGLLSPAELQALWRYRQIEFWLAIATLAGVLLLGMLIGIVIAVGLSMIVIVLRASSPSTAVLGRIPGTDRFRDVADNPQAIETPGLLIYRFDAPLFFANAGAMRDEITRLIEAGEPRMVLFDTEAIYDIDSTAFQILVELLDFLDDRGVSFGIARLKSEVHAEMAKAGLVERIGSDRFYLEVDDGVEDFVRHNSEQPQ